MDNGTAGDLFSLVWFLSPAWRIAMSSRSGSLNLPVNYSTPNVTNDEPKISINFGVRPRRSYYKVNEGIQNQHLNVVAIIEPPYVNYLNLSKEAEQYYGHGPGIVMEILRDLQTDYNITFEFFLPADGKWGSPTKDGGWDGAFGYLHRKEADLMAGVSMLVRKDRYEVADFVYPIPGETGLLIRSPQKYSDNTLLIVIDPFSWEVWSVVALSIVISGILLKLLTTVLLHAEADEVEYTWFESIWVFFSVFVQQGLPVQPRSCACRCLLACWWLASLTLIATFTGNLVALFAVDKTLPPFTDLEGMVRAVETSGYKVVMDSNSQTRLSMIRRSHLPVYQRLYTQLNDNDKLILRTGLSACVNEVKQYSKRVFLANRDTLQTVALADCDITILDKGILQVWQAIPLVKGSPYVDVVAFKVRTLQERGFVQKWKDDYNSFKAANASGQKNAMKCANHDSSMTVMRYLDLDRAQGAFWMLLLGALLALSSLCSETLMRFFGRVRMVEYSLPPTAGISDVDSHHHHWWSQLTSAESYQIAPTPNHHGSTIAARPLDRSFVDIYSHRSYADGPPMNGAVSSGGGAAVSSEDLPSSSSLGWLSTPMRLRKKAVGDQPLNGLRPLQRNGSIGGRKTSPHGRLQKRVTAVTMVDGQRPLSRTASMHS